jgi:hypothetical protein
VDKPEEGLTIKGLIDQLYFVNIATMQFITERNLAGDFAKWSHEYAAKMGKLNEMFNMKSEDEDG